MLRKTLKHCIKVAEACFAIFSGLLLIVSILVFFVFWKLSHGPVDMTWAQPYIQKALADGKDGVIVKAEGIVAEWKDFQSPLTLGIANLSIQEQGQEILNVSEAGLKIAKVPLLIGIVSPEAIYIKNPSIRFEKSADGQLSFLIGNKTNAPVPLEQVTEKPSTKAEFNPQVIGNSLFLGGFLADKSQRLPLSRLQSFVIENAAVTIDDKTQNREFVLPDANLTLTRDYDTVNLVIDYQAKQGDRSKINAVVIRKSLLDQIKFVVNLHKVETGLWALHLPKLPGLMKEDYTVDGRITGVFDTEWTLKTLNGDISTAQDDVQKQSFSISADRDPQTGVIPLELSLAEVTLDQIASIWPDELKDYSVSEWFTKKLSKGTIKNIKVSLPFRNENGQWLMSGDAKGSFDFENLTCDYRAPLIPITEGSGHAVIANDNLVITIDKAKLDNMDIKKDSSVTITKLSAGADEVGEAIVKVNLTGPLATAFKYISLEPISLGDRLNMDPAKVEGQADAQVTVTFPTLADLPADQVVAVVDATLSNTKLPGIVHGMDVTGGPLALKVEKGQFTISGNGALNGIPLDFTYSEYIDPATAPFSSDLKAKLVTDDELRAKFGIDLSDYVSGKLPVDVAYQKKNDGMTSIDIKADLTPARAYVVPLNYLKKEGIAGSATTTLLLKGDTIQNVKDLNITIGKDSARNGQLTFGTVGKENNVTAATFESIKLGDTNDLSMSLTQNIALMKIAVKGASVDARSFVGGNKIDTGHPASATLRQRDIDVTVTTQSMRMGDKPDQILKTPVVHVIVNPQDQLKILDLKSKVGKGSFSLDLSPSPKGIMNLRMDSDDAGAALNALGTYENMVGGTLSVSGYQMPGGGINDIKGAALITDFKVVKAPALAQLIGAFSITGLPELLANDGISFAKLRTDFIWKESKQGRIINLYDGATGGGSVGLTFGGIINQTEGTIDISGTFVPISQINKIVSSIPIVGQLLTGGKNGGIIAATYSMKGPSNNPKVMINPLSVLAPGFLRSILFEGGLNSGKDEAPSEPKAAPKKAQAKLN